MNIQGIKVFRAITLATVLALSGCQSGSDETNTDLGTSTNTQVTADTDLLVQNAARNVSANIGVNLDGINTIANNSTITETLAKTGKSITTDESKVALKYHDEVRNYILPTLSGGNASRIRRGNTITIDPDEQYVCEQWLGDPDVEDINNCTAILSELTVQINASSDESGTLGYLYAGADLVVIEYAPFVGSYEFFLPAFESLFQRASEITGDTDKLPDTLTGAVKLATRIDNATERQEAGNVSFTITQPLQIANSIENYSMSLGRSVLFEITSNAATGNANIAIDVQSLSAFTEDLLGPQETDITTIEMPDFTMSADLTDAGTQVLLSNFGMGNGPFAVAINNSEVVSVSLEKFSARYNDLTRRAEFFSNLNLSAALDNSRAAFGSEGDDSSYRFSLSTAGGTVLSEQLNGSVKVENGGPLSFRYSFIDGTGNGEDFQQDSLYTTGQCFDEPRDTDGLELVSCD